MFSLNATTWPLYYPNVVVHCIIIGVFFPYERACECESANQLFGELALDAQQEVLKILDEILRLGSRLSGMSAASPLLGAVPEVDSMAVVAILTTLEERFGFIIEDDEMDGSVFATVGSLSSFVERKLDVLSSAAPLLP